MIKVYATGYVVKNARVNSVSDTQDALNFTVASNRSYKSGEGRKEVTDYADVTIFGPKGKLNGMAEGLLIQGQGISLSGRLQTDVKHDESGNFLSSNTYVVCEMGDVEPMGKRPAAAA